jgi:large subunit ribosomal protein L15
MIDTDRVDISQPLDLSVICNTGLYKIDPMSKHFGIQLTDEVSQYTSAYGQSSFLDTE